MGMTFYLVRHGHTAWLGQTREEDRYQTRSDVPLSKLGVEQARRLAQRLASVPFESAYASDLARCAETARIILDGRAIPLSLHPALREIDVGEWEGLSGAEIDQRYPGLRALRDRDPLNFTPPGGESIAEAITRFRPFCEELRARHADNATVLIVSHQNALRVLVTLLLDIPLAYHRRFLMDPASVTVIRDLGHARFLALLNDTSHLNGLEAS